MASHNFCLQTLLFCMVSFQLRHQRSLAASFFTPSSHLNQCFPTDQFPVNSAFRAFSAIRSRGSLCTRPAHFSFLNLVQDIRPRSLYLVYISSFFIISDPLVTSAGGLTNFLMHHYIMCYVLDTFPHPSHFTVCQNHINSPSTSGSIFIWNAGPNLLSCMV